MYGIRKGNAGRVEVFGTGWGAALRIGGNTTILEAGERDRLIALLEDTQIPADERA